MSRKLFRCCYVILGCAILSHAQSTLTCNSDDGKRHYCNVDTSNGVRMAQQISGSSCVEGSTWGFDNNGIWVDRGCRAQFTVGGNGRGSFGNQSNFGNGQNGNIQTMSCSSDDGHRNTCNVNTAGGVRMVRQISGSPCEQGRTWGYDRQSVWVDRGCRAEFAIGGNNRYNNRRYNGNNAVIQCSSDDGNRHYCNADTSRGIVLSRQISGSACTEGSTWGFDNRGIWVDRGCRAEFQASGR